jgi:acetyltransferase-like isoleucine patch superfamily enzyme
MDKLNTLWFKLKGVSIGKNSYVQFGAKIERFYKNVSIGEKTVIKPYARICSCNKNSLIEIGNNVSIGHYTFIYASSNITIGDKCMIAPFNYIVDSNHKIEKGKDSFSSENVCAPIIIEANCWLGQNSTILAGSIMRSGGVLGAKSLLNSAVNQNEIFVGIPAKLKGIRK